MSGCERSERLMNEDADGEVVACSAQTSLSSMHV